METNPHIPYQAMHPSLAATDEAESMVRWFEDVTARAVEVQAETLRRILMANRGVEYLSQWLGTTMPTFDEMEPVELESLYTALVPLASHGDFEPYFQRIADGDRAPLLTQQPIELLSLSSGTTEGRQKFAPFTRHSAEMTVNTFRLAIAYRSSVYPIREGGKILEFIYSSKKFKTKGGLTVGTATTHYYSSEEFRFKQNQTRSFTCSPEAVISGGDYRQSTYCHLLLGLLFREEIEFITSTFAYTVVQAFRALEDHWRDIVEDLRDGTLSPQIVTLGPMRAAVLEIIGDRPRPTLAEAVEAACEDLGSRDWAGVVPILWPNAKYVYSIMTGSMQHYMTKLRHYCGGLPLVSADYGATESWIGVNVDPASPPERVTFAVVPTFSYFEFIPLYPRQNDHNGCRLSTVVDDFIEGNPVPLSQVKMGQQYEIVLTTFTGLYRYRLGDMVEVAGFHNRTPKLSFLCRRKLILTINIDKNTEMDLQLVVDRGSRRLKKALGELVDYTSHANTEKQPGHYIIYWEIRGDNISDDVLKECCCEMDAAFTDAGYVVSRKSSSIGPLELRIVEADTFGKILGYFIGNGAGLNQYKTPRCTSNPVLLGILDASTVRRFHSTAYTIDQSIKKE
ncbi:hypothetical protein SAY86_019962 [Trapa natans]|uniref:Uncharacterized protein n=1 Tax=Trapa natans TaxID=22666 RepID=A0AAN7R7A1_TRANT|nr:hypothetical protein SAY86_019962 [Trapa natans]